jgi:hypothetical protein
METLAKTQNDRISPSEAKHHYWGGRWQADGTFHPKPMSSRELAVFLSRLHLEGEMV